MNNLKEVKTKENSALIEEIDIISTKDRNLLEQIKSTETKVLAEKLIITLKEELKFDYDPKYFKSGACSERIPDNENWYYVRAVSILKFCIENPRGIKKLRRRYGKLRNLGSKPSKKYLASGFLLRHLVQELERNNYLAVHPKGRYTSERGKKLLETAL